MKESFTLPHGHPSGARGSGGAKAESEVESATILASADGPKKTTRKRVKAEAEQVQPPEKETVEVDSTGSAKDPTEDKPEE